MNNEGTFKGGVFVRDEVHPTLRKSISDKQRVEVFLKTFGKCGICGGQINLKERWDIDHIIPLFYGGSNDIENLQPAHESCHRDKTRGDHKAMAKTRRILNKMNRGTHSKIKKRKPFQRKLNQKRKLIGKKFDKEKRENAKKIAGRKFQTKKPKEIVPIVGRKTSIIWQNY